MLCRFAIKYKAISMDKNLCTNQLHDTASSPTVSLPDTPGTLLTQQALEAAFAAEIGLLRRMQVPLRTQAVSDLLDKIMTPAPQF